MKKHLVTGIVGAAAVAIFCLGGCDGGKKKNAASDASAEQAQSVSGELPPDFSAVPLPPDDGMTWVEPATAPAMRSRVSDEVYRKAIETSPRDFPLLTAEQAKTQSKHGLLLKHIVPKSQAQAAGLQVGDVLLTVDGRPLVNSNALNYAEEGPVKTLGYLSRDGVMKTVTIKPGKIGIMSGNEFCTYVTYMQSADRNEKFDPDIRAAIFALHTNNALAETALSHVQNAGYHGQILYEMMAFVADEEHRDQEAFEFAMKAMKTATEGDREMLRGPVYQFAVANFKFEVARDLVKEYPGLDVDPKAVNRLESAIAAYRALPAATLANPIERIRTLSETDYTTKIIAPPSNLPGQEWAIEAAKHFSKGEPVKIEVPAGHFPVASFAPYIGQIDLSLEFQFVDSDKVQTPFSKNVNFFISNPQSPIPLARITFRDDGKVTVERETGPNYVVKFDKPVGVGQPGHFRVVIDGQRIEAVADGRRILYGPVLEKANERFYGFVIHAVGASGEISHVTYRSPPAP